MLSRKGCSPRAESTHVTALCHLSGSLGSLAVRLHARNVSVSPVLISKSFHRSSTFCPRQLLFVLEKRNLKAHRPHFTNGTETNVWKPRVRWDGWGDAGHSTGMRPAPPCRAPGPPVLHSCAALPSTGGPAGTGRQRSQVGNGPSVHRSSGTSTSTCRASGAGPRDPDTCKSVLHLKWPGARAAGPVDPQRTHAHLEGEGRGRRGAVS